MFSVWGSHVDALGTARLGPAHLWTALAVSRRNEVLVEIAGPAN
jgi:hypothetical protein